MNVKIPALIAVKDQLHENYVVRLEWADHERECDAKQYDSHGVQGSLLSHAAGDVLVLDYKSQTKATDFVLQVDDSDEPGVWVDGDWTRPRPRALADADVTPDEVLTSWEGGFEIVEETRDGGHVAPGLRSPQVGALYAALAHWRVSEDEATIVLPTGTGKTEAMLAIYAHQRLPKLLVIVPTTALRTQIGGKFLSMGVLQEFGILTDEALLPFVGFLKKGITSAAEVADFVGHCNVIVATMSSLRACNLAARRALAEHCTHMFVDEAHHRSGPHRGGRGRRRYQRLRDVYHGREHLSRPRHLPCAPDRQLHGDHAGRGPHGRSGGALRS